MVVVVVMMMAALTAACGSTASSGTQPGPGVTTFGEGVFSDVPLPYGATPAGPRSQKNGVDERTYGVEAHAPADVVQRMTTELGDAGWTTDQDFQEGGQNVYRGQFLKDGRRLVVSVSPAPDLGNSGNNSGSQISLLLGADTSPILGSSGVATWCADPVVMVCLMGVSVAGFHRRRSTRR